MWRRSPSGPSVVAPRPHPQHKLFRPPLKFFFKAGWPQRACATGSPTSQSTTTKICAWLDLETKARVVTCCEPEPIKPAKHWSRDKGLMSFLKSLRPSISYVAVEPVRAVPVAGCLNERHITGIATKWNDPAGVLGPNAVLDSSRFGGQTQTVPGLFQSTTSALRLGRKAARS
jgi:hypothetical protein